MDSNRKLDELGGQLQKVEELLKFAGLYGGKISLGDKIITIDELKEMRLDLKSEIAAEESRRNLHNQL
jgi:hypothetical protein